MRQVTVAKFAHAIASMAVTLLCVLGGNGNAAPLSVEQFFQPAQYGRATLSPSGKYLAVVVAVGGRLNVGILDLDASKVKVVTSFSTGDVLELIWQNDDRLIALVGDLQRGSGDPPKVSGVFAFDRDGGRVRQIGPGIGLARGVGFHGTVPGGNEIIVEGVERSIRSIDLYRTDTLTGGHTLLTGDTPGYAAEWVLDYDNVPRAVVTRDLDKDKPAWYVRKSATDPWQKVDEAPFGRLSSVPLAFSPDGTVIYAKARRGTDRLALYEYQIESGAWKGPIAQQDDRDVQVLAVQNLKERKLYGFRFEADRLSQVWFDPAWDRMQKSIDAALPDTVNVLQHAGDRWIIVSYSDRNPGEVSLLDAKTLKLQKLFSYAPWIKPEDTAETKWIRYPARDGLSIPALLTLPKGSGGKNLPLVVDIHGGPNVQATPWGFQFERQFLASRGYAVIEPQYRGTEGFGAKFEAAGFRRWGDAMQDDLEDGVKWAVAEGIVDPQRVCFYGASYGGYAAMWGAIKNAKVIKCAVATAGVSSIDYLFDNAQTDMSQFVEKSSLASYQIGDPKTDRARFKRVNPLDNAERVGVPILLTYGGLDRRVPMVHGTDFRAELDKYHKPYEWLFYSHEAHGLSLNEDIVDYYTHVEAFLNKYIGPDAAKAKPQ